MKPADELDWDDLRYFLAVVQGKTLAGAARSLGVEHTTVGRRLSALERALGGPLVLRGADGLKLTRLGERLAPRVEELQQLVGTLKELAHSESTRVRLSVPSGFATFFTSKLADLSHAQPGLTLEILSGSTSVDLAAGEADLALRSGPVTDPDLVVRRVGDAGFSLYAADSYLAREGPPQDVEDLSGHSLIGFHTSLMNAQAAQWMEARARGASIVLRSREMVDMLAAAVDGVGLALLPCSLADSEPRLRRLTSQVLAASPLSLVHRREVRLSSEVRAVIRFVVDVMKNNAAQISGKGATD